MTRHSVLRDVRVVVRFAVLALAIAGFLVATAPASAAKPHGGASYFGFEGSESSYSGHNGGDMSVLVSSSGRKFIGGKYKYLPESYVDIVRPCGPYRRISLVGTRIHGGRFAKTVREGPVPRSAARPLCHARVRDVSLLLVQPLARLRPGAVPEPGTHGCPLLERRATVYRVSLAGCNSGLPER